VAERRISTSAEPPMSTNSTRVLVSWPSPMSRQAQREGPLRAMDRFEEPANPRSPATPITTSPCHPASGISFASRDVGSGSDSEVDPEDEISLYEQSESDWAQDYIDAESGTSQNKRKRRTQAEKEAIYAKKSQKQNHPNLDQIESNNGELKVSTKPPSKQYNYSLPCPYHEYDPDNHADCNGCSFDSISHLWYVNDPITLRTLIGLVPTWNRSIFCTTRKGILHMHPSTPSPNLGAGQLWLPLYVGPAGPRLKSRPDWWIMLLSRALPERWKLRRTSIWQIL
jgi:hypothetical protein